MFLLSIINLYSCSYKIIPEWKKKTFFSLNLKWKWIFSSSISVILIISHSHCYMKKKCHFLRTSRARGAWSNLIILVDVVWGSKKKLQIGLIKIILCCINSQFLLDLMWKLIGDSLMSNFSRKLIVFDVKEIYWNGIIGRLFHEWCLAFMFLDCRKERTASGCLIIISWNLGLIEALIIYWMKIWMKIVSF